MKVIKISRYVVVVFTALVFALSTPQTTQAQWTQSNTAHAWSGFMNNFLYTDADGFNQFTIYAGSNRPNGMWESAELIEMAEDGNRVPKTGITIGTKLKMQKCPSQTT